MLVGSEQYQLYTCARVTARYFCQPWAVAAGAYLFLFTWAAWKYEPVAPIEMHVFYLYMLGVAGGVLIGGCSRGNYGWH